VQLGSWVCFALGWATFFEAWEGRLEKWVHDFLFWAECIVLVGISALWVSVLVFLTMGYADEGVCLFQLRFICYYTAFYASSTCTHGGQHR
jgi:hypothetical protein